MNQRNIFSYENKLKLSFNNIGRCSIGEARNYAIKYSNTDYLIFLDSDDALLSGRIDDFNLLLELKNIDFIWQFSANS